MGKTFIFSKAAPIGCEAHTASHSENTKVLSRKKSGRGVKLITHLPLIVEVKNKCSYTALPPYMAPSSGQEQFHFTLI